MRKLLKPTFIIALFFVSNFSFAQNDINDLIDDMLLIADNFAAPGAEGATLQSSAGWFSSASTLNKWQVEVSVHGNALFVPSSKQNKLINNNQFNILEVSSPNGNALLPTVYGGDTDVMFSGEITNPFNQNEKIPIIFDAIDGLDKKIVLHAFPQVTIGLPFKTEIAVRYLPKVFINDVGISTVGLGLKHNFSQYFYKRFNPEDFQFALVANYSNFKADYKFLPIDIEIANLNRIEVDANMYNVQLIGSKLYDNFEVMGGLGYTNSDFDYSFGGTGASLPILNEQLGALGTSEGKFKGNIGFNYYANKFKFSTVFSASGLFNANVGLHYRFN
ncbi:hypothetical protein JM83_0633 [Gillisia sp. Hel_I_86]|uniref:DUF6588 family protein n=1 Tax=Gillisia sp. Hel_I_86 TaxID=1249981 RepID=UPI00119A8251|nr:DUF6588 family protein [Gillisia sp. Hel_I_86]TVZ25704.1 hypothetical protein JM83_0633 [Gillisia sp. Hel_I_86]